MMTQIKQLFKFGMLLVCCGFLSSCSNEDELTNGNGTLLPDGKYPLMLTATLEGELMTRAAGKDAWTGGEVIGARIGTGTAGSYTVATNGTTTAVTPAYWQNTAPATVTAWYPADAQNNVDISDQSGGFAHFDFLKAEVTGSYSQTNILLPFKHQMAKVKVTITKANTSTDLTGAEVRIFGRTSLSYSEGTVTSTAANEYIIPQPDGTNIYEALLVPQQMQNTKFIRVEYNGDTYYYIPASATDADLKANQVYEYTIYADGVAIDPSQPMSTLTEGRYLIDGTGKGRTTNPIVIDGSPTVILRNVDLAAEIAVSIIGGSPTLIIEGTTRLGSTGDRNGVISLFNDADVTISGNGTLNLLQTNESGDWGRGAIIGSVEEGNCGNINISNVTINISAIQSTTGIGSAREGSCGDITIKDATITIATPRGSAGIGNSYSRTATLCGNIRILNSDINITYGNRSFAQGAAIGCGSRDSNPLLCVSTVQGIYITLKAGQTKDEFLSKLTTTSAHGSDKVGQGYSELNGGNKVGTITDGVHWFDSDGNSL